MVWQWNCRGFKRKRAPLELFIKSKNSDEIPDVVCLQETGVFARMSNYKSFNDLEADASGVTDKQKPAVSTLVRRNLPALRRETGVDAASMPHILVEIITDQKHYAQSTFILNVYSSPKNSHKFSKLFRRAVEIARGNTLLIVGD